VLAVCPCTGGLGYGALVLVVSFAEAGRGRMGVKGIVHGLDRI